jgi:hypothetical protein
MDEQRILRSDVFRLLAAVGRDPQALAKSRAILEAYVKNPGSIDAALAKAR